MPIEILMPALSPTMVDGKIANWLKKEGDEIKAGDILAEIETDKAIMEVESVEKGILGKILVGSGTSGVKINTTIGLILKKDETKESIADFIPKLGFLHGSEVEVKSEVKDEVVSNSVKTEDVKSEGVGKSTSSNDRVFASPLAKRIAKDKNIDISRVTGTGPHGRVVKKDLENAKSNRSAIGRNATLYSEKPISTMRSVIAQRLTESKTTVPHFYLDAECDVSNLISFREAINNNADIVDGKPVYKISVNDIITKCVAHAIARHPDINTSWSKNAILSYNNVDISIAVAIQDGLITPIVKNADQKSLIEISDEIKSLVSRAKVNDLKPDEFQGGGFSISNLGMYGTDSFKAIVNPPQSCILAVGGILQKPVVKNGNIVAGNVMNLSLSVDHRVVDGAVAAMFLSDLKRFIENPFLVLI